MTILKPAFAALALTAAVGLAFAQETGSIPTKVTVENFARAESDMHFGKLVSEVGVGVFKHHREPTAVTNQPIIRMNRDTLYSNAVFDLDAGPVTITLPVSGDRFMSLQLIDEDHYVVGVQYGAGTTTVSREEAGTRYVWAAVRTFVDSTNPADIARVHALQDQVSVTQDSTGTFEVPAWDQASQKVVREALLTLGSTVPDSKGVFGREDDVDPVRHLVGTAAGWGGNPEKDAVYLNVAPARNDGSTVYTLEVGDVPVDGFWSISVYNAEGYFTPNDLNAYSLNNITALKDADSSVTVQFGGCDGKVPNCLPITEGWSYTVRLYRPRAEILDGSWTFPEPRALS